MERGRFCRPVTNPREGESWFTALFERQCNAGENRSERAHLACRRNHAMEHVADMEILPHARRIRSPEVFSKHIGKWYPHLVTCPSITNHGPDFIDCPVERMNIPDSHSLFAGAQPSLSKHSLPDPPPEGDVVKPKAQHACIHPKQLLFIQFGDDSRALRLALDGGLIFCEDRCVRLPGQIFRRIEDGVTFHISEYSAGGVIRGQTSKSPKFAWWTCVVV